MSIRLILKKASIEKRQLNIAVEVHCQMQRPSARVPRIEAFFDNGWDNRRMVMNSFAFRPLSDNPEDTIWVASARFTFLVNHLFAYGTWEKCSLRFDIGYDGSFYESVPIELTMEDSAATDSTENDSTENDSTANDSATNDSMTDDSASGDSTSDDSALDEEASSTDLQDKGRNTKGGEVINDRLEFREKSIEIILGTPAVINPPLQPGKIQVLLGFLVRIMNVFLGILCLPWYFIDVLGIIFLPTERKDQKLNKLSLKGKIFHYLAWRFFSFCRFPRGKSQVKTDILRMTYKLSNAFHRKKKTILFLSNRRNDLSGNFEYIYPYMKEDPGARLDFWLNPGGLKDLSLKTTLSLSWKCGRAKIILIDDYTPYIRAFPICQETMVMQLWHACGAFKTFGFSRLGKKGGTKQITRGHRDYRYCFVSSANIAKYYAEGFGIAQEKVLPYGVPRTDMFFDEEVRRRKREEIYTAWPDLKDKKVILFAPTFRGAIKDTAYYDMDKFNPNKVIESLSDDYVLIIKHHPFVSQKKYKHKIAKKYKKRIFDFSTESEINDLLFITDILITDYSSVIYEASLLNIPMVFYAYDLEDYISSRDFYFEYEITVPGKIVFTQEELIQALIHQDYEHEKVEDFCKKNFDIRDGKASKRIADFILQKAAE